MLESDAARTQKRLLLFTAREWGILGMGVIGAVSLSVAFPDRWLKIFIAAYGLGFLYEASMDPLFTYHAELSEKHCIGKTDINFLFPLGWMQIVGLSSLVAERVLPFKPPISFIIAGLLIGSLSEHLFFRLKYWVYHYDAAYIGNFRPFLPKITIGGVPVQVMLGYGIVGAMIYGIVHWLVPGGLS